MTTEALAAREHGRLYVCGLGGGLGPLRKWSCVHGSQLSKPIQAPYL